MVSKLDDSVGSIVEALNNKNILSNTVVVFLSDNGAPTVAPAYHNWGSNYPLRGVKQTLFEGGIRGAALIYSPLLVQSGRVSTDLMHITDWLPTLYSAAGGDIGLLDPDLDGIDQWSSLVSGKNDGFLYFRIYLSLIRRRCKHWGTGTKKTVDDKGRKSAFENISKNYFGGENIFLCKKMFFGKIKKKHGNKILYIDDCLQHLRNLNINVKALRLARNGDVRLASDSVDKSHLE